MSHLLSDLQQLDRDLLSLFDGDEPNSEEIFQLIDNRERLLQDIFIRYQSVPDFSSSSEWQEAIDRTKYIVQLMQQKTSQIGEQLRKYRHGNKSVQRYQQFL